MGDKAGADPGRERMQGVFTPPPSPEMTCCFVFDFNICLPHQSMMPFLIISGAPSLKQNPESIPAKVGTMHHCQMLRYRDNLPYLHQKQRNFWTNITYFYVNSLTCKLSVCMLSCSWS